MDDRLRDVYSYELFDTTPEKHLDEITELASIICDTPISLITILDDERQWFKSNIGLSVNQTKVEDSFCQHALHRPNEVLVVEDALKDDRFVSNRLVTGEPNIRFYAGAPLITKNRNVLGTLCVIDRKPRAFSRDQERALQLLAKKAMDRIETQRIFNKLNTSIELNAERLTKITENIPLGIFELVSSKPDEIKITFLSEGMKKIFPNIELRDWLKDPYVGYSHMHPDDVLPLQEALAFSLENMEKLHHEYRVIRESGYDWIAVDGQPHKNDSGETVMYGAITNVTHHFEYEEALEQIAFDISHVLRRPVTSILAITNLLESEEELSFEKLKEYSMLIKTVTKELEEFTRELNAVYSTKKAKLTGHKRKYHD